MQTLTVPVRRGVPGFCQALQPNAPDSCNCRNSRPCRGDWRGNRPAWDSIPRHGTGQRLNQRHRTVAAQRVCFIGEHGPLFPPRPAQFPTSPLSSGTRPAIPCAKETSRQRCNPDAGTVPAINVLPRTSWKCPRFRKAAVCSAPWSFSGRIVIRICTSIRLESGS